MTRAKYADRNRARYTRLRIDGDHDESIVRDCPASPRWRAIMVEMADSEKFHFRYTDVPDARYYICAQVLSWRGEWVECNAYPMLHPLAVPVYIAADPIEAMGLLHKLAHEDIPKALVWLDPDCLRVSTGRKPTT